MTYEVLTASNFGGVMSNINPGACELCPDLQLCNFPLCKEGSEKKTKKITQTTESSKTTKTTEKSALPTTEAEKWPENLDEVDFMGVTKNHGQNAFASISTFKLFLILFFLLFKR